MNSNNSQNNNINNGNNNTSRLLQFDQLFSSLRSRYSSSESGQGANTNNNNNTSSINILENQQSQSNNNSAISHYPGLLNSRFIVMRRDSNNDRNNQRSAPNRSSSYQYITNSNRGGNHLIIESQVMNMSPVRIQQQSSNLQSLNSNHFLDASDNENQSLLAHQEDKDYMLGTENLAVTTENIDFVKCTICMHIYQNPIACGNCLNHFCSFCIREWLSRNPGSCPLCKNFREMRCVPMLKNMLDKLQFFCSNKKNGCEEVTRYEQVIKHEDQCGYKIEICPIFGCGTQMIKKLLDKHIQEECEFVLSKCRWCASQIKKRCIEEHEDTCDKKEVICELCGDMYQFKDQQDHHQKCPELIRDCSWCQKKYKQKEIRDHEDCCGERIVRCKGCNYECCLNDHFLHTKTCQEIPVFCKRCETEMKRKDFSQHQLEQCIENVQRSCSQKIFQLESENRELRRQLSIQHSESQQELLRINNIVTRTNQNQPFQFSQIYRDQDIFVTQQGNMALVREYKKKRRDRFIIADQPKPLLDSTQIITFKVLSRRSEWFAIGICDESNIYSSRRYHDIGHLSYLISANGILYSSHSPHENWQNRPFRIEQDDVISVQFIFKPAQAQQLNSVNSSQVNSNNQNSSQINNEGNQNQSQQDQRNSQINQVNNINQNVNNSNIMNIEENRSELLYQSNQNNNNNNNNNNQQINLQGAEMKLKFVNHTENQELDVTLDPTQISNGKFYYCACLRCPGDSIEILPSI